MHYAHQCQKGRRHPIPNLAGVRWIQNPLDTPGSAFYPQPAGFFFLRVFAYEKKPSGSACIDASRLIFQSAVSFQIRLVAKNQAGPTRLFFCIPAVKPSEFTERTLSFDTRGPRASLLCLSVRLSVCLSVCLSVTPAVSGVPVQRTLYVFNIEWSD